MVEIQEGICGNHPGERTLVRKVMKANYYWPPALKDAEQFVKKCTKCEIHASIPFCPPEELTLITSPWPFIQWGLDIMGPMLAWKRGVKFIIGMMDYFTKWVEVEPFMTITTTLVITRLLFKAIVCRFGIPWVNKELQVVLWVYWTTIKAPIGETPFALNYGSEVVIPVEIGMWSYRV